MKKSFEIYGDIEAQLIADRFQTWQETFQLDFEEEFDTDTPTEEEVMALFKMAIDSLTNNKPIDKELEEFIDFQYGQAITNEFEIFTGLEAEKKFKEIVDNYDDNTNSFRGEKCFGIFKEGKFIVAFDNQTGHLWTENFNTIPEAINFINNQGGE